jgi:hypothetical protein
MNPDIYIYCAFRFALTTRGIAMAMTYIYIVCIWFCLDNKGHYHGNATPMRESERERRTNGID